MSIIFCCFKPTTHLNKSKTTANQKMEDSLGPISFHSHKAERGDQEEWCILGYVQGAGSGVSEGFMWVFVFWIKLGNSYSSAHHWLPLAWQGAAVQLLVESCVRLLKKVLQLVPLVIVASWSPTLSISGLEGLGLPTSLFAKQSLSLIFMKARHSLTFFKVVSSKMIFAFRVFPAFSFHRLGLMADSYFEVIMVTYTT